MIDLQPSAAGRYTYEDLVAIVSILRSDEGCPWDREQTHDSIKYAAVEEAYELMEAINNLDQANLQEELGDLLLQVLFHSQIGKEAGHFTLEDVVHGIAAKLVYRHPHVFGTVAVKDAHEVLTNWDELKKKEKAITSVAHDLKQVPKALPAQIRARKVQKKAAKAGAEFEHMDQVFDKVQEEIEELKEALTNGDASAIEEEFGDILFGMVNLSRFLGLNPENALTNAVEKFITRFEGIENLAKARNQELSALSADEFDVLWEAVKSTNNRSGDC